MEDKKDTEDTEGKEKVCPECDGYGGIIIGDDGRGEPIWDSCPTCHPMRLYDDF